MYGILIVLGIVVSALIAEHIAKKHSLDTNILWNGLLIGTLCAIFGARLYHVLDYWNYYQMHLLEIFTIWHGGLGILGGLAFGLLGGITFLKFKKQQISLWVDLASLVTPLGQSIGRWGNYINKELLPYALYESLADFILFLLLLGIYIKFKFTKKCLILSAYLIGYSLIRIMLDTLHPDSWTVGNLSIAKASSASVIIAILVLYALHCLRPRWFQKEEKNH